MSPRNLLIVWLGLSVGMVMLLITPEGHAQHCDYGWQPVASTQPPYLVGGSYAFAEFQNPCGQCELIATVNGFGSPAAWDGACWRPLGGGVSGGIASMLVFDDGSGPGLFVAGRFRFAGGVEVNNIAKWDGRQWSSLAGGVSGSAYPYGVYALEVFDDGRGPALYAGGYFHRAGDVEAHHIARWNGRQWEALDQGLQFDYEVPIVWDMEVYDDDSGSALYVSGTFTDASDSGAQCVAGWDGRSWSALGGFNPTSTVPRVKVYDDGAGTSLFLTTSFPAAVGKWDGQTFTALPGVIGQSPFFTGMEVFDDGSGHGDELYVGGDNFGVMLSDGRIASNLVKWNGERWSSVGEGLPGAFNPSPTALFVSKTSNHLVMGRFTYAGLTDAPDLLAWSSNGWLTLPLLDACPSPPSTYQPDIDDSGCVDVDDLIAVILAWGPCPPGDCPADVNGDGAVDVNDLILVLLSWA